MMPDGSPAQPVISYRMSRSRSYASASGLIITPLFRISQSETILISTSFDRIFTILYGSFVETVKELLLAHNPLYGRIGLAICLRSMGCYDAENIS